MIDFEEGIEFCPCGDMSADQCDGDDCEYLEELLFGDGIFAVMPEGLPPEEIADFDY